MRQTPPGQGKGEQSTSSATWVDALQALECHRPKSNASGGSKSLAREAHWFPECALYL